MGSKILLADDSITIQKVVNLTFADEGIDVVTVSNGEMAERRLAEINPDLVLADIFMPGRNGYELCQYVKESPQFRNTPVVLLVGAFEPFDQAEAKRVRADAHLTKPFESRTLVDTVRRLIQNRPRTGPLHSGSLHQTTAVKETRRLDEEPAPQVAPSMFDSTAVFSGSNFTEAVGYGQTSPGFPLVDSPPASMPGQHAETEPEPFSVGYNPMWQTPEAGREHSTQELPTISIDIGEPAEEARTPEFNPSTLTAEAEAADVAAREQGFSFSVVEPQAEAPKAEAAAEPEPIQFEPTVAAQIDTAQAVQEAPREEFVPEQVAEAESPGFAVPSLFGDAPPNAMIDFDVVGEEKVPRAEDLPVPPVVLQESPPVAFEVDFGDTLPLPPNLEQRNASHAEHQPAFASSMEEPASPPAWMQSQSEVPLPVPPPAPPASDGETAFAIAGLDAQEPQKAEPEIAKAPEIVTASEPVKTPGYLAEEEPLGDFLAEEEAETQQSTAPAIVMTPAEEAPQIAFQPSDSVESAFELGAPEKAEEPIVEETGTIHVFGGKTSPQTSRATGELEDSSAEPLVIPAVVEPSPESETGFAFADTEKQAIAFQPISTEPERVTEPAPVVHEPGAGPVISEQFTAAGMWESDAKFSPIDFDASPAGEPAEAEPALDAILAAEAVVASETLPGPELAAEPLPDLAAELGPIAFEPPQPEPPQLEKHAQTPASLERPQPGNGGSFAVVQPTAAESEVSLAAQAGTNGDLHAASLSAEAINEIVKRVVAELSDSVVREIAWEVVPDCVERVIEKLSRESLSKRM